MKKLYLALGLLCLASSVQAANVAACTAAITPPVPRSGCNAYVMKVAAPGDVVDVSATNTGNAHADETWMKIELAPRAWYAWSDDPSGWTPLSTLGTFAGMSAVATDKVTLIWTPPTKNTDGSDLTNLAGYHLFQGTQPTAMVKIADLPLSTSFEVTGLGPGSYFWAMTAFNTAGGESAMTNTVTAAVTAPAIIPTPPSNAKVQLAARTVYTVLKQRNRFILLPIGSAPVDTPCDPTQNINGYSAVPYASVAWAGSARSEVVVAKCN